MKIRRKFVLYYSKNSYPFISEKDCTLCFAHIFKCHYVLYHEYKVLFVVILFCTFSIFYLLNYAQFRRMSNCAIDLAAVHKKVDYTENCLFTE